MTAGITITFADSALGDLEGILAYYRDQQAPQAGERLVADSSRILSCLLINRIWDALFLNLICRICGN